MSDKPKFVYVIYIAATPEKVFAALTDGNASVHYWHGTRIVSDWKVGAPFLLKLERGDKKIVGKIAEYEPPRQLACTFQPHFDGMDKGAPSHVAFDIERQKDQVIVHDGFEPDSKVFEGISGGWPLILSSLKSFIEAGKVLRPDWYRDNACATEGAAS
ncbi:MAG: SRPBCC family protein [Xanthobacteraceae bacterium]